VCATARRGVWFRPKHSTSVQSTSKKNVTCAFFLGVTKSFDIVWICGILYSLTIRFQKVERRWEYGRDFEAKFDKTMLD
jgi:hypothetical protein